MMVPLVRLKLVREGTVKYRKRVLHSNGAVDALRDYIKDSDCERVAVALLDTQMTLVGVTLVSVGGLAEATLKVRDVYKAAIVANAHAIVLAHNHPSGNARPSPQDRDLTGQLALAGNVLGIPLLDHVIVTAEGNHYSFADEGLL
jgi:DNA repair protein RadC